MTETTPLKPQRKRIVITRSRNGCMTCKARRVRCDERVPSCLRCENFGIRCDGYISSSPSSKSKSRTFSPKVLLPKTHPGSKLAAPTLNSEIFKQLFRNEQEHHYFTLFCTKTAKRISGHFSSKLWQGLILQSSEREPIVRHAVIALGALINSSSSCYSLQNSLQRKQFAYHQYQLSISLLRTQTHTNTNLDNTKKGELSPEQLRTTLLACILFSIFETYNGYITSATTQIYAGIRLLSNWQHSHIFLASKLSNLSSPSPLIIPPELIAAFSELETEAMCRHDTRPSSLHDEYRYFGQLFVDDMPEAFEGTEQARGYLVLIGQRALHFTAWMKCKSVQGLGLRCPVIEGERGREVEEATRRMGWEYDCWEKAFEGLWNEGRGNAVRALRIQLLTARAWSAVMQPGEERFGAKNRSLLEEIVTLTRKVREDEDEEGFHFGFEGGLITALRTIGFVFRHRALKREAMAILLERPWKEGLWDSWIVGKAMEWLIEVEDEGLDEREDVEYVTEDRVLRDFQMCQDEMGRRTIVSGFKAFQEPCVEVLERRELVIPWLE